MSLQSSSCTSYLTDDTLQVRQTKLLPKTYTCYQKSKSPNVCNVQQSSFLLNSTHKMTLLLLSLPKHVSGASSMFLSCSPPKSKTHSHTSYAFLPYKTFDSHALLKFNFSIWSHFVLKPSIDNFTYNLILVYVFYYPYPSLSKNPLYTSR